MNTEPPKNDGLCLVDHHARLAVLEALLPKEVEHVRREVDLQFIAKEKEHEIQAVVLEKRLGDLNNEGGRLLLMSSQNVRQDVYHAKIGELEKALLALQLWQSNMLGRMAVVGTMAALFGGCVAALLVKWLGP